MSAFVQGSIEGQTRLVREDVYLAERATRQRYEAALREILAVRQQARAAVRSGAGEYLTPWHAGEMANIAEEALAAAQEGK